MSSGQESAGDGPALEAAALAIARERDGFAALLGRLARSVARDAAGGAVSADFAAIIERRIGTMTEQLGLGLHLVGTRPLNDPNPGSTEPPALGGGV